MRGPSRATRAGAVPVAVGATGLAVPATAARSDRLPFDPDYAGPVG